MLTPRLLILTPPSASHSTLTLLTDLTGSAPTPPSPSASCAGLTHTWAVQTAYYTASIPIWIDEIANPQDWQSEFSQPEAKEVVEAVGAWVCIFDSEARDGVEARLKAVRDVLETHDVEDGRGVMLAVFVFAGGRVMGEDVREELDGVCMEYGFEFVEYAAEGLNVFGEKQGLERVREALEAGEWTAATTELEDEDEDDLGLDDGEDLFGAEGREMNAELFGLKASLLSSSFADHDSEDDNDGAAETLAGDLAADRQKAQVDDLDVMMSKLLAVREQSADLPEAQRKKMAARAVREIMGE